MNEICSIDGCPRPVAYKRERLCNAHYLRLRRHGNPLSGGPPRIDGALADRFWAKVHRGAENECWPWLGSIDLHGHGQINIGNNLRRGAHRVAHELVNGPIPAGLDIDHVCHNADLSCPGGATCLHRRCCNPRHLQPATRTENSRRGAKGRPDERTQCSKGHPLDESNTYVEPSTGYRKCRICRAAKMAAFLARRRAA